jgi:hypothetical protein
LINAKCFNRDRMLVLFGTRYILLSAIFIWHDSQAGR